MQQNWKQIPNTYMPIINTKIKTKFQERYKFDELALKNNDFDNKSVMNMSEAPKTTV